MTRYTHDTATDPATPETGHTSLIDQERIVSLSMDNGWSKAVELGRIGDEDTPVVVDMDPAVDPILFWAGKRNRRDVPLLPLQRNEIVTESRIARIIERARERAASKGNGNGQASLPFADLEKELRETEKEKRVEFYTHEEGWKNKLICGDSLGVMESLITHEGLHGKVQMIYVDPPYGVKYDSNFQQRIDTTENTDAARADDVLSIKAFSDTWVLGIHSYLAYLSERLYLSRELLQETGSIFVQISDDHAHRVRSLMDEVFGSRNYLAEIILRKRAYQPSETMKPVNDYLLWYAKDREQLRVSPVFQERQYDPETTKFNRIEFPDGRIESVDEDLLRELTVHLAAGARLCRVDYPLISQDEQESLRYEFEFAGRKWVPASGRHWSLREEGMRRLAEMGRVVPGKTALYFKQYFDEFPWVPLSNVWMDLAGERDKVFAVQTSWRAVLRCIHLASRPGDLVFDPTCGSGTTAYCAELSGRRWVTCDTSRVATNVARQRLLRAIFPHFETPNGSPASGFVYETSKRVTPSQLAYDLEAEPVPLVDRPEVDPGAVRVTGPFEVMSLGRYSLADWEGYLAGEEGQTEGLENYVTVISRLYRKDASLQESGGFIHALADLEDGALGLSIGPISGRVTARQLHDAANEAVDAGIKEVHVLGWAFEANVGEVKSKLEEDSGVKVQLVMIRPDTLAEGLKVTKPETLFSPLALPEIRVESDGEGLRVTLEGVGMFDRKTRATAYKPAHSGYVSAWYLDEDYDGDCFVDCQMFLDFKKKPAIEKALGILVDPLEWELRLISDPFEPGKYGRIAVKVVDVYGNESTVVRDLS